jgi:putative peptidoglycan lipid II flippase
VPWYRSGMPGPHAGLAVATSISAFLNAGLLYRGLRREGVLTPSPGWGRFILRIVLACGVMAMLLNNFVPPAVLWLEAGFWTTCYWLLAAVFGGAAAYVGVLLATGMRLAELQLRPPAA